ncbi:MAG: TRAP transporter substrate-binding protein DctP [Myxococcota bacterium]
MKRPLLWAALFSMIAALMPFPDAWLAGAQEITRLRIATLAPRGSTWMRVFNAWNQELKTRTENAVQLQFYPGGVQGDERDFVQKMEAGQMDGAAVTTTGLSQIARPILVLAAPGVAERYEQIDKIRGAMQGELEELFTSNGYVLLGWGDVGKARIFSKEPLRRPVDLTRQRPWAWREDQIFGTFLEVIGANPVRLGVPEVYPALQTGQVNAVPASALAAVSLQWHTRLRYVTEQNSSIIVGATLLKKARLDALSPEHRQAVVETAARAHSLLTRAIRRDDDRAYQTVLERGISAVSIEAHRTEWEQAARQTRQRLVGQLFSAELLRRVQSAAAGDH